MPLVSQILVEGKVLKLPGQEPIPFANIGIVNTAVGTISNEDGSYWIKIPPKYAKDSVIFSALGFGKASISVSDLANKSPYSVRLREIVRELETILVKGDSWKKQKYKLGNRRYEGSCLYADTITAGSVVALLINTSQIDQPAIEYPLYLKEAQLRITDNTFGKFKVRTRIYSVDSRSGSPGKDLLETSVVTRSELEDGILRIDLSEHNLKVYGNFYLAFEWILDQRDRKKLFLQYGEFEKRYPNRVTVRYGTIDGKEVPFLTYIGLDVGPSFGVSLARKSLEIHKCYYRFNSFGQWIRSASILAAGITLTN